MSKKRPHKTPPPDGYGARLPLPRHFVTLSRLDSISDLIWSIGDDLAAYPRSAGPRQGLAALEAAVDRLRAALADASHGENRGPAGGLLRKLYTNGVGGVFDELIGLVSAGMPADGGIG